MRPIIIEQETNDTKLAVEVHQSTSIRRVRLVRAKLAAPMLDVPSGEAGPEPISVQFNFRSKALEAPPDVLRIEIAFKMSGSQEGLSGPAVSVECAFAADYEIIRPEFHPTPEHVKAFKDGNAIFNVWPYFREYLQSSLLKMGLPPLVAPFLCLRPASRTPADDGSSRAPAGGNAKAKAKKQR